MRSAHPGILFAKLNSRNPGAMRENARAAKQEGFAALEYVSS
jgi:hypothetical protein